MNMNADRIEGTRSCFEQSTSETSISEETFNAKPECVLPEDFYEQRLQKVLSDTGEISRGIVAIEAWMINEEKSHLIRPCGAWWRDRKYKPPCHMDEDLCYNALNQLEDSSRDDYLEPAPLQPGLGLGGLMWAESTMNQVKYTPISEFNALHDGTPGGRNLSASFRRAAFSLNLLKTANQYYMTQMHGQDLVWRDLNLICADPDTISDRRCQAFANAGIGQAAGVPFESPFSRGIILYFAKSDSAISVLNEERNMEFLKRSSYMIGSILDVSNSMISSLEARHEGEGEGEGEEINGINKFPLKNLIQTIDLQLDESVLENNDAATIQDSKPSWRKPVNSEWKVTLKCSSTINKTLKMLKYKICDPSNKIQLPPPMSNSECVWTFIGCFVTVLSVAYISTYLNIFTEEDKREFAFPLGPIGALATLLFGLTSAPASQPRNVIYGTFISGIVGLTMSYLPSSMIQLRVTLAISISTSLMAKCGVIHPPAGALAMMLCTSEDKHEWISWLLYLFGSIIAIFIATLFNNLNEKRTYPQYWKLVNLKGRHSQ